MWLNYQTAIEEKLKSVGTIVRSVSFPSMPYIQLILSNVLWDWDEAASGRGNPQETHYASIGDKYAASKHTVRCRLVFDIGCVANKYDDIMRLSEGVATTLNKCGTLFLGSEPFGYSVGDFSMQLFEAKDGSTEVYQGSYSITVNALTPEKQETVIESISAVITEIEGAY